MGFNFEDKPIFIFGASLLGKSALSELLSMGCHVEGFFDNSKNKVGGVFERLQVHSISEYHNKFSSILIIVASQFWSEIVRQLFEAGCDEVYRYQATSRSNKFLFVPRYRDQQPSNSVSWGCTLLVSGSSGSNTLCLSKSSAFKSLGLRSQVLSPLDLDETGLAALRSSDLTLVTHHFSFFEDLNTMQFWHGFPLKTLGWWNKSINNQAMLSLSNEWRKHSAIFSYSKLYSSLIESCFRGVPSSYVITGMPRNDFLFRPSSRELLASILQCDLNKSMVGFWLPTYRETQFGSRTGSIADDTDIRDTEALETLVEACETRNVVLVVKDHPYEKEPLRFPDSRNIFKITDSQLEHYQLDLYELLGSSDFLVTDYSSVYFDYLLLDRPIIFYQPDLVDYDHGRGFLLDETNDFWTPGIMTSTLWELKKAVDDLVSGVDRFQFERQQLCDVIHRHKDNSSCARVANFIKSYLEHYE